MSRQDALRLGLIGLLGIALGCGPTKPFQRPDPPTPPAKPAPPPVIPPAEVPEDPVPKAPVKRTAGTEGLDPPERPTRRPLNILAVSGGGAYGAFSSGVLNGWSRSGTRPDFDVVTGVSTGALIAPYAFLGQKYDYELKKSYTEVKQRDVFVIRSIATLPFRDAVADSGPLRKMVSAAISDEVMAEVAAEHKKGRRLYVGTTALETKRTVVWDLGAIAAKGGPDARKLICDVLVASCSIPGAFPPVEITVEGPDGKPRTELHVDGGVTTPVFVPPSVFDAAAMKPDDPAKAVTPNLFVIVSGKYFPAETEVRPRLLGVLKASGGALLSSNVRRDLANLYHMATLSGVRFHSVALKQDFPAGDRASLDFDQKLMQQMFVEGVKVGVDGPVWDGAPPERAAGEPEEIRTGPRMRKP